MPAKQVDPSNSLSGAVCFSPPSGNASSSLLHRPPTQMLSPSSSSRPIPGIDLSLAAPVADDDDDTDPFSDDTGRWTVDDTRTSSSSQWSSDAPMDWPVEDPEPEPRDLSESYHFRGAQYDTVRTIIRPNPRFIGSDACATGSTTGSPPSTEPPCSERAEVGSSTVTPVLPHSSNPLAAVIRRVEEATARIHFEEDVIFREHEWLLEQAGCGRVEIWVTEERRQYVEGQSPPPRVFFLPPAPVQSQVGRATSARSVDG